jgi:hypothetical protein
MNDKKRMYSEINRVILKGRPCQHIITHATLMAPLALKLQWQNSMPHKTAQSAKNHLQETW